MRDPCVRADGSPKVKYTSESAARFAVDSFGQRRRRERGFNRVALKPYHCAQCGFWHLCTDRTQPAKIAKRKKTPSHDVTFRRGESVRLGPNITVTVLGWQHGRVRIGVNAPREVLVLRSELLEGVRPRRRPSGT